MSPQGRSPRGRPRRDGESPPEGEGPLADTATLRRIELVAVTWTGLAAAAVLGVAWRGGVGSALASALVLTAVSALSIVAFRGLQRIVSALGPASPAPGEHRAGRDETDRGAARSPDPDKNLREHRTIGWRQGLEALVRLCLLGALVVGGTFLLDARFAPALVLGFSTLPAALMTEGLLQMVRALRGKEHDGFS